MYVVKLYDSEALKAWWSDPFDAEGISAVCLRAQAVGYHVVSVKRFDDPAVKVMVAASRRRFAGSAR